VFRRFAHADAAGTAGSCRCCNLPPLFSALLKMRVLLSIAALCLVAGFAGDLDAAESCPAAHAHNDYLHERPLLDALEQGFCSVEADVFVVDGRLLVAHDRKDLTDSRTLKSLYLEPLRDRLRSHNGKVHTDASQFTLLIDFKTEGQTTYAALRGLLAEYRELFTATTEDGLPPVSVVISGNRPFAQIEADTDRLCGLDGRLSDLDSTMPADLMPMISDNWRSHFKWRGEGPMPAAEQAKLSDVVHRAHAAGRRVRFWATPENEVLWAQLSAAGVDHINTDQLKQLRQFLTR